MKGDAKGSVADSGATSGICTKGPAPPTPPAADCKGSVCVKYSHGSDTSEAAGADAVIYFAGTSSSEGGDRSGTVLFPLWQPTPLATRQLSRSNHPPMGEASRYSGARF
jgi:hypothetical protein